MPLVADVDLDALIRFAIKTRMILDDVQNGLIVCGGCIVALFFWNCFLTYYADSQATEDRRLNTEITRVDGRVDYWVTNHGELIEAMTARIATLETRLKAFEALERLGLAAQLGEEMMAATDAQIGVLEAEMATRIAAMQAQQDQAVEAMRERMNEFTETLGEIRNGK